MAKRSEQGELFWGFVIAYALMRIPLDLTRAYEPGSVLSHIGRFDVTESQLVSVTIALIALLMLMRVRRSAAHFSPDWHWPSLTRRAIASGRDRDTPLRLKQRVLTPMISMYGSWANRPGLRTGRYSAISGTRHPG